MIFKMKLNEAIKIDKYKKLKDSIHDIVTNLPKDKWLTMTQLSKKLKEFNITISSDILLKFLNDWKNDKKGVFTTDDEEWLYFDDKNNSIFSSLNFKQPASIGKSRRKIRKKEIKNKEEKEEFKRKSDIDKLKQEEKENRCPIPSEVIFDTFEDIHISDVSKIMKLIHNAIKNKEIEFLYEPSWDYMIEISLKTISEGGLGLEIKNDTWTKHKPNDQWVLPEIEDLDKGVPIWHFKYGKGIINDVNGIMLEIDFDDNENSTLSNTKKLKLDVVINNKSIRIDKDYTKNKKSGKKGYSIAYLKDLKTNDTVFHKKRKINGVVTGTSFVDGDNFIKLRFDGKIIKLSFDEFLKYQNIIVKTPIVPKKIINDDNNWTKVKNSNELKIDQEVKFGSGIGYSMYKSKEMLYGKIKLIDTHRIIIIKNNGESIIWGNSYFINTVGVWKKSENWVKSTIEELKLGMVVKYGLGQIRGTISKIDNKQISIDNEYDTTIVRNLNYYKDEIWKIEDSTKTKPKNNTFNEDDWVKIKKSTQLKIGDNVSYNSYSTGEKLYGTISKLPTNSYNYITITKNGNTRKFHTHHMLVTLGLWKKKEKSIKSKQLDVFNQENRELNKFEDKFNMDDYKQVSHITEINVGDQVYTKTNGTGVVDELKSSLIYVKHNNKVSLYQGNAIIATGNLFKKSPSKINSFDDHSNAAYKTTGNIGFNKTNNDIWVKIKDKSELEKGMVVLYGKKRKKIKNLHGSRLTMYGGGSQIDMEIANAIKGGIFKNKLDIKKSPISPTKDGWIKSSSEDIWIGNKVHSIVHNVDGIILKIVKNSINIKLNEPKTGPGGMKIISVNTSRNNFLKEWLTKKKTKNSKF